MGGAAPLMHIAKMDVRTTLDLANRALQVIQDKEVEAQRSLRMVHAAGNTDTLARTLDMETVVPSGDIGKAHCCFLRSF